MNYRFGAQAVDTQPLLSSLMQVLTPTQKSLTFCDATPNSVQKWLDTLPKANLGETARLLYQGLVELNQLQTTAANRLALLELFRVEVQSASRFLERYFLDQPVVLEAKAHKVATLCLTMQSYLAVGYKQVLADAKPKERGQIFATALQRALHTLYTALIRSMQLYGPPPKGLWLDVHQLYVLALQEGVQHQKIKDQLMRYTESQSIEQAYTASLLLGIANGNHLRRRTLGVLGETLESWSALTRLQKASALGSLFIIDTQVDAPPRHRVLVQHAELSSLLGLDTLPLTEALQSHLEPKGQKKSLAVALAGIETVSLDVLQGLYLAWSQVAERKAQRIAAQGRLSLCLGMTAVHYYLAGKRPFNELLNPSEQILEASSHFGEAGGLHLDPWGAVPSGGQSSEHSDPWQTASSKPSDQSKVLDLGKKSVAAYPEFDVEIVNQSMGGYCLSWSATPPEQLQVGELLGLHSSADVGWMLAVVRWIYLAPEGQTQMGVQLLSAQAQPCAVQLIQQGRENSQHLRALLLSENTATQQPPLLLAPLLPFQEGQKVAVLQDRQERQALLTRRHSGTFSYNLFEYRLLEAPRMEQPSTLIPEPKAAPKAEDFDSLWKIL
ncbi:hypothetical protein LX59_01624 [Azomonas agilis]|uniref:Molecular chaperone n=1 Tax=Azomonas agilis TaxID=116849 RepID=A0A562IJZ3_9GAMM|nr:hypothetical protein LX59_01624 [Azomonas agilis]